MQRRAVTYIGRLCKRGHSAGETGGSERYVVSHTCVACCALRQHTRAPRDKRRHDGRTKKASDARYQARPDIKAKRAAQRRLRHVDPARRRADQDKAKAWRESDAGRAQMRAWRTANQALVREHTRAGLQRRRARRADVVCVPYSAVQIAALRARYEESCAYCGQPATAMDHVVPIARRGHDALYNLAPACKRCNSSKNDSLLEEWYARQPFFSLSRLAFMAEQHVAAGLPALATFNSGN